MPASEVMYDSVTTLDIPPSAKLILAYIDGKYKNWDAVKARFPNANVIAVSTVTLGSIFALVFDCERGDGNANQAAAWCKLQIARHVRPTVYCSRIGSPGYGWPDVQKALTAVNIPLTAVDFGIADYTGKPHLVPGSAFTQYANPPASGGDYDVSLTNGIWPNAPEASAVLNKPAAAIVPTKSGKGYWIVAQDGGVFDYGDAQFHGSLPGNNVTPAAPIVDMAVNADESGYWLLGSDGGVFAFGNVLFYGAANK